MDKKDKTKKLSPKNALIRERLSEIALWLDRLEDGSNPPLGHCRTVVWVQHENGNGAQSSQRVQKLAEHTPPVDITNNRSREKGQSSS